MKVKAYFDDIQNVIIKKINQATSEIQVAVAWFTAQSLLNALSYKAQQGVSVEILLIDDEINKGIGRLNFSQLENFGGKVSFITSKNYNKMHHKFCVIDKNIVITGSYNWTNQAQNNQENIMITEGDLDLANEFLDIFRKVQQPLGTSQAVNISADTLKRRLEMIKNFILLDEIEEIESQLKKLNTVIEQYKLNDIVDSINKGAYQQTVEQITHYLTRFTTLVASEDIEVSELKFELKLLELKIESLSNEKIDIERNLLLFNRRQFEILGDLTRQILKIKAEYLRLKVESTTQDNLNEKEDLEQEVEEAEETYNEYSEEYEEIQHKKVHVLNEEQAKDLKKLYRLASKICHPDRVPADKKEQAHEIFIEVNEAYKNSDFDKLSQIYQRLKQGCFSKNNTSTLKAVDILRSTISEMRYKVDLYLKELSALQQDQTVLAMYEIGFNELTWIQYFERKKPYFKEELNTWTDKLKQLKNENANNE